MGPGMGDGDSTGLEPSESSKGSLRIRPFAVQVRTRWWVDNSKSRPPAEARRRPLTGGTPLHRSRTTSRRVEAPGARVQKPERPRRRGVRAPFARRGRSGQRSRPVAGRGSSERKTRDSGESGPRWSAGAEAGGAPRQGAKARARRETVCDRGRRNPVVARTLDRNLLHEVLSCPR